jgi:DNA-binding transcriptional LysR family regulator
MELRHLRYFVGVAHHLNYSEASRRLHVAQPAISQTVLDLEAELGVKLLHRTKRTVQLTTAGAVFLGEAEQILRHATEAAQVARRAAYLAAIFTPVKNKPRIMEEHDSMISVISAIEAGTGVGVGVEALGYSFGSRVKLVRLTPEPKPLSFGIATGKGKLSPATEKFCQCAKEAFDVLR